MEGHSPKIVIRVSASQRGNDFEVPDLERGYTYFFLSWKFQIASSHKTQNNKKKQTVVLRIVGRGKVIVA